MTETFQILILLMVVISAVAVVARRLDVPPAVLLVITGVGLALVPGLPTLQLAPDLVLVLVLPPVIYWSAVEDELAGIPIQPPPDYTAGFGLRRVHDGRSRRGDLLAVGLSMAGRLRFGRNRLSARPGGAVGGLGPGEIRAEQKQHVAVEYGVGVMSGWPTDHAGHSNIVRIVAASSTKSLPRDVCAGWAP